LTKDLYTSKEIAHEKQRLLRLQNGIDPILKILISDSEAVCDHSHESQHIRAALHRQSNAFEGLVFNAYKRCIKWVCDKPLPEVLRNLADYLEKDYSHNPHHSGWIKKIQTKFNTLKEKQKDDVLTNLGYDKQPNGLARKNMFKKAILSRQFGYPELKLIIEKQKE
jgi:hypothetical protein